ncbi:cation transporter [Candidatus Saccharibacteria bacterium]|nr:cation transporter [Candidatus Saccharibacteria bacterium]
MTNRNRSIMRVSLVGIAANLILSAFKIVVGIFSNSIAIIIDAVNNLSDIMSSVVTIIGAHFAGKEPDKEHPMGHGRSEYLSTVIIAVLIIYIGLTALVESIRKIIVPEAVNYQVTTIIVVSAAIVIKVLLGLYVRARGKKLQSGSLIGSGIDALYDAIISAATLVAIIIFYTTGWSIEAYLAACISLFILHSGIKLLRSAFSTILGQRPDANLSRKIKESIAEFPEVEGAYDLVVHDYGAGSTIASVNIEVDRHLKASQVDHLSRDIQKAIFKKYKVMISSVGIYAIDLDNPDVKKLWHTTKTIADKYEHIIQLHGFHADLNEKKIHFDVVVDFALEDRRAYFAKFSRELKEAIPDYELIITQDVDTSD